MDFRLFNLKGNYIQDENHQQKHNISLCVLDISVYGCKLQLFLL